MSGKTQDKVGNEVMFDLNQNSANPNSVPQTQKEGGQNFDMTAPTLEAKIPFIQKSESQNTESPNSDMQINFDIENQNAKSEEMEFPTPYTDTTPKRSRSDNEDISTIKLDPTPKPPQLDTRPKSTKLDPLTSNEIEKQNADFENMKIQNESTEQFPMESPDFIIEKLNTDPEKLEKFLILLFETFKLNSKTSAKIKKPHKLTNDSTILSLTMLEHCGLLKSLFCDNRDKFGLGQNLIDSPNDRNDSIIENSVTEKQY
jgi:hypothetical protein